MFSVCILYKSEIQRGAASFEPQWSISFCLRDLQAVGPQLWSTAILSPDYCRIVTLVAMRGEAMCSAFARVSNGRHKLFRHGISKDFPPIVDKLPQVQVLATQSVTFKLPKTHFESSLPLATFPIARTSSVLARRIKCAVHEARIFSRKFAKPGRIPAINTWGISELSVHTLSSPLTFYI